MKIRPLIEIGQIYLVISGIIVLNILGPKQISTYPAQTARFLSSIIAYVPVLSTSGGAWIYELHDEQRE